MQKNQLKRCKHTRTGRWTDCEGIERCERCWGPVTEEGRLKEELNQGSLLTDHPFVPRKKSEPWGLCECGLGEAAHAESAMPYRPDSLRAAREGKFDGPADRNPVYYNNGKVPKEVQNVVDGDSD